MAKEDVAHMNAASGKKLTYDTLNIAMTLHERHTYLPLSSSHGWGKKKGEPRIGGKRNGYGRPRTGCGKDRNRP
eukprot:6203870-Pleurochrysis_carterae.AAC.1